MLTNMIIRIDYMKRNPLLKTSLKKIHNICIRKIVTFTILVTDKYILFNLGRDQSSVFNVGTLFN